MPSLGPLEILVVAVLALIVFGPERLPEMARTLGRTLNELKRMAADVRTEFETGMGLDDVEDEPEDLAEVEDEAEDEVEDEVEDEAEDEAEDPGPAPPLADQEDN